MMRKDFAKKKSTAKPYSLAWWRRPFFLFLLVLFLAGVSYLVLQYKHVLKSPWLSSGFSRIETWMAERKQHLQKGMVRDGTTKIKEVVANKNNAPPQVHFEFYTALPNMQVTVSDLVVQTKNTALEAATPVKPSSLPVQASTQTSVKTSTQALMQTSTQASTQAPRPTSLPTKHLTVVNAEELEQEFSKQLKQNTYVVQLGVFRNATSADQYHKTVSAAGFEAAVVKLLLAEKPVYRVQLGPFLNKGQAKIAQRQLQKKGMNGLVLKVDAG